MRLPPRIGWLRSGRFLRLVSALAGLAVLAAILYNATVVDRIPPTYTMRVSSQAANGKALTLTAIDVTFTKDVKHDTAEKAFSTAPVIGGSFHWQGLTMIFTPSEKLPLATTFKVHMAAGVEDKAGNVQNGTGDSTFTTVGKPAVTSMVPAPSAAAVAVDSTIQITFDRLMDTQKVVSGLQVSPLVNFSVSWTGPVLTLTPSAPLAFATSYSITIGDPAVDTDGTPVEYATSFTTVGLGLHALSLVPANNVAGISTRSQIAVVFDGPLDPTSVSSAFKITPPVSGSTRVTTFTDDAAAAAATAVPSAGASLTAGATVAVEPKASPGLSGNVLVFTPDSPLAAHTTYTVNMNSTVRRTDGEGATPQVWTFTTGEPAANALNQIAFVSGRSGVANVWLMNPDGSNQRQITSELVAVNGFDVSGDGTTIAYGVAGVVKRMSISGDNLQTLTASNYYEYGPTFTPSGTGLVVGRRAKTGADMGYWLIPLLSGSDTRQLTLDGAPPVGSSTSSSTIGGDDLVGRPGEDAWAPRAAFSQDGSTLLLVRGSDAAIEIVDMTGVAIPVKLTLVGNSRGVWQQSPPAFYVVGSSDGGINWSYWRITTGGSAADIGPAAADLDTGGQTRLVYLVSAADGRYHVASAASPGSPATLITDDTAYDETSPSFSPDGSAIVFGRVESANPAISAGIWTARPDGTGLTNLSVDGADPRWLP